MKVEVSKTLFKDYSKCNAYYSLDNIYYFKNKEVNNNFQKADLLKRMFDEDGFDLVKAPDEKLEIMKPYYKEVERIAMKVASRVLGKEFKYYEDNMNQKYISFIDSNGYLFYTYLDGYYEDNNEIYIIEVKATTSHSFLEMGPKIKGERVPLFEKNGSLFSLNENVHDSKMNKHYLKLFDRNDECGKYFYDLGISSFIFNEYIKKNNLVSKKIKYYLAILNSNYEYDGLTDYDNNSEEVINFIEADKIVEDYQNVIYQDYLKIINNIKNKECVSLCNNNCFECVYEKVCFPFLNDKDNIKTLFAPKKVSINGEKLDIIGLINNGYKYITDIPFEVLDNKAHIIQRECFDNDEEFIDKIAIKKMIDENIVYPIYHLDFESFQSPLPRFYKEKPYMQSVFQFSIHIQKDSENCDLEKDGYHFLPSDFLDHREELIEKMIEIIDLSKGGTVLVYNKNFEYTRIKELIKIYPKYKEPLEKILSHMFDLLDVLKKGGTEIFNYYHKNLHGSFSIKKVLPIFSNLSYDGLDVKNGVEAQNSYASFKYLEKEDIERERTYLLKYCGQDTYSMYEVLKGITKKIAISTK